MTKKSGINFFMNMLPKALRPQNRDFEAMALWNVTSVVGFFWLVQPWDWISEQLFGPEVKKSSGNSKVSDPA